MDKESGQQEQNKKKRKYLSTDRANNTLKRLYDDYQQLKRIQKVVSYVRKASALSNPYVVVGIIFVILVLLVQAHTSIGRFKNSQSNGGNGTAPNSSNPVPGLTLTLSGPSQVNNGDSITYTLDISYEGTDAVTIIDPLPKNATFAQATGIHNQDPNADGQIVWDLTKNSSSTVVGPKVYSFTIVLSPIQSDTTIQNVVFATSSTIQQTPQQNIDASSFELLMAGQGRNTAILGDENNFTTVVLKNGVPGLYPATAEPYIRKIYEASVAKNVNPLIMLTIWGVEHSFIMSNQAYLDDAFSCPPRTYGGFDAELSCAANSLNNLMNTYDQLKAKGTYPVPLRGDKTCYYTDQFFYAYEAYTPVCITNDGNDAARTNFVTIYKKLYGNGN